MNIYIVYELGASSSHDNDPTLKNGLFGGVTLTKNAAIDKYGYSGYGIGFDRRPSFLFSGGGYGQNILIFRVDLSSSVHIDNRRYIKDILVFGKVLEHRKRIRTYFNCRKNQLILQKKIKSFV